MGGGKEGRKEEISNGSRSNLRRLWDGFHFYLGRVFLHCLEVEERGVDQVIAMNDSYQLPFNVVALTEAQHLPQLWVLKHTHTHTLLNLHFLGH